MQTDYSGGQISSMVENVVLIKFYLIYGTMLCEGMRRIHAKIAWSGLTLSIRGCPTTLAKTACK